LLICLVDSENYSTQEIENDLTGKTTTSMFFGFVWPSINVDLIVKSRSKSFLEPTSTKQWG